MRPSPIGQQRESAECGEDERRGLGHVGNHYHTVADDESVLRIKVAHYHPISRRRINRQKRAVPVFFARIAPVEETPIVKAPNAGPVPMVGSPLASGDAEIRVRSPVVVLIR